MASCVPTHLFLGGNQELFGNDAIFGDGRGRQSNIVCRFLSCARTYKYRAAAVSLWPFSLLSFKDFITLDVAGAF